MSNTQYATSSKLFHWITLLLVIGAFASIELRELFEKGTETRDLFKFVHFQLGAIIFIVTLARLVNRKMHPAPDMISMEKWQTLFAKGIHIALVLTMLIMPVLGCLILISEAKDVTVLGFDLPQLWAKDKSLAHDLEEAHETLGNVFLVLVFVHAAAAIWHHRILKDNTLSKMLPRK